MQINLLIDLKNCKEIIKRLKTRCFSGFQTVKKLMNAGLFYIYYGIINWGGNYTEQGQKQDRAGDIFRHERLCVNRSFIEKDRIGNRSFIYLQHSR